MLKWATRAVVVGGPELDPGLDLGLGRALGALCRKEPFKEKKRKIKERKDIVG